MNSGAVFGHSSQRRFGSIVIVLDLAELEIIKRRLCPLCVHMTQVVLLLQNRFLGTSSVGGITEA